MTITIEEIRKLIDVVRETGISELEVKLDNNSVRIVNKPANQEMVIPSVVPVPLVGATTPAAVQQNAPVASEPRSAEPAPPKEDERTIIIKSPIVGTYYDAPTPGAPPFVKVGDRVEPKQVLCIIESMKLMNEIEAEITGVVVAKHVENGRPVEYGEALFTLRPL